MKSGPISLVIFSNQFGAFLSLVLNSGRSHSLGQVGRSDPGPELQSLSAASMGKKIRGKKRAQPDAANQPTSPHTCAEMKGQTAKLLARA